ncbi:MAG: LL-diaminopimelate aminotransferase [Candidatus Omnitrophica bacterium]|nr:LL-diaminopimelate aminotransferase [Candidatus Omnitrophota bacterium]
MTITINPAERLKKLPPYLFAEIDRLKREAKAKGKDIIDLGVGDPDIPTPAFIIEELYRAAKDPSNHRYALDAGMPVFREEIARWYDKRFGVKLDSQTEILPLIGSKEGIAHLPLAVINPGDVVLVPDPCYPPYKSGTWFAGGEVSIMPLEEENGFLPNFAEIDPSALKEAKLMFLNYPNNPTAAVAPVEFYQDAVEYARRHDLIIASDAAYSEMAYDGYRPVSLLNAKCGKDVGIEFHSLSKTFNMTGWRVGFAVGNPELIKLLAKVKSNIDSGIFQAIQFAGIRALKDGDDAVRKNIAVYQDRRDVLVDGLEKLGWKVSKPKATFYVWASVPAGYTSAELCSKLLKDASIVVTPGNGFGANGEGYIRFACTVSKERILEMLERIKNLK